MKSNGVNAWLRHWLKLQKQNKCPLIFKDGAKETHPNLTLLSKHKAKASKGQSTNDNKSNDGDVQEDGNNDKSDTDNNRNNTIKILPQTPLSASET